MNRTSGYNLPLWEASDPVKRADFNNAMSAIDAALRNNASAAAGAARIVVGTYTGDGTATQFIDLGATPKAVLVFLSGSQTHSEQSNAYMGGLALPEGGTAAVNITTGGFNARYSPSHILGNMDNANYFYLALL